MRNLLSLLLILCSFASYAQMNTFGGIGLRVNDTTTYQTNAAAYHSAGYRDIYFNNQATSKHFDIWNGSSYQHGFGNGSGSSVTPAALTRTSDTNVILTLGGTPSTAVLQATSLTMSWFGQLAGTRGGTGVSNAGNLTYGSNNLTFTTSGSTSLTLPTSGTLYATGGALGTPSSGTLTNATGLPAAAVVVTPAGNIAATNAGSAINELDVEKVALVNSAATITDASTMDIASKKNTLATSSATRTFTISYTGDDITVEVTLSTTACTFTFPATTLCVSDGVESGDNNMAISGVSGDKYIIAVKKIGSNYYAVAKNFGQ